MDRENFQNRRLWLFVAAFVGLKCWIGATTGLGDDEAYYWQWSQLLELNYYDHPPMTAWLIALSSSLFGHSEFAVRFPSMVCGTLAILFLFKLASSLYDQKTARWSVALFCLIPIYSLGSILMVPDVPMLCIWLAMLLILKDLIAARELRGSQWMLLGFLAGIGLLIKFTMILLPGSAFLYLLFHRRSELKRPGPWIAIIVMLLVFSPVLFWNAQNGWASFQFHFSDRHSSQGADWIRYSQFIATQLAFLSPFIFIIGILSLPTQLFFGKERGHFLFWMSAPTLILFGTQALFSEFKPHWTAPGFLLLIIVVAAQFARGAYHPLLKYGQGLMMVLTYAFLIGINALFFVQTKYPIAHLIYQSLESEKQWQPKWDPTNDLYGGPQLAEVVNKAAFDLEQRTGQKPFFAAERYQLAAPLAFYSHQSVWTISNQHDQYDHWQKPDFKGHNGIIIADNRYSKTPDEYLKFSHCEILPEVTSYRYSIVARKFKIWICYDYQGDEHGG